MRQAEHQDGFTLIEVSLAIVVGMLVVGGAMVLFQQSKVSAQNSAAKEKLIAASVLVTELGERNYALPTMAQLQTVWKARRPDDYDKNPWGGTFPITGNNYIDGNDSLAAGTEYGSGPGGTVYGSPAPTAAADRGRIFYFRRDPSVNGKPYIWLHELSVFGTDDPQSVNRVTGYGLAMLGPNGEQWYFVAGKDKTNTAGNSTQAEGQVGD